MCKGDNEPQEKFLKKIFFFNLKQFFKEIF